MPGNLMIMVAASLFVAEFLALSFFYSKQKEKGIQKVREEYEERYRRDDIVMKNILSTVHSHVVFFDKDSQKILYGNLGSNNKEFVTENEDGMFLDAEKIFHGVKNPKVLDELIECLKNQIECNVEIYLEFTNGKQGWYRIQLKAVRVEGIVIGFLLVIKNITEDHEKREALLAATQKQNKAFMALSHEFRTPVNAISGSIDMLSLSENLNSKQKSHIKNIKNAYKALIDLVAKATDYTKIQSGEMILEEKEFTVYDLLDNVRTMTHMKAYEKGIGYCIDFAPDIPTCLIGDVDKISCVLQSLLYNAIEHTDEGCVTLAISRKTEDGKDLICYSVTDTGHGIKEEFVDKIFEEFIGFEIDYDGYTEGLGVSLFISRKIIELMNGTIKCESRYGEGSCFSFELELKAADEKPIASVSHPEDKRVLLFTDIPWKRAYTRKMSESLHVPVMKCYDEADISTERFTHIILDSHFEKCSQYLDEKFLSGKKILVLESSRDGIEGTKRADSIIYEPFTIMMFAEMLNADDEDKEETEGMENVGDLVFKINNTKALVVDDNAVNLMVASNVLMQYGIEVEEADSGSMAVRKYYENDYDIIFMDYLMPGMNGVETIRNIRNLKKEKETVIIALSANVSDDIIEEFAAAGANHVMSKPLELKELSEVLKKYIPAEKIEAKGASSQPEETEPEQAEAAVDKEDIKSILYRIKGLDVEKGLANVMGDTDTYVKVLNVCCTNITEQVEYIKAAYRLVASGGLKIYFHSLKGILANIGAMELSEYSKEMEIAARDQNEAYIKENVASYIEQVEEFRDSLKWAVEEYKKLAVEDTLEVHKEMGKREYEEKMEQLITHIKRFEFNEINELMEELISASEDEERENLKEAYDHIQQFQYEEALELVEKGRK